MENQQPIRRPRRRVQRTQSSFKEKMLLYWQKTKEWYTRFRTEYPILYNILIIIAVFMAVLGTAEKAMRSFTRHGTHCTVPDFMGINVREAYPKAKAAELEIVISDSLYMPGYEGGIIVDQLPRGGAEVKSGRKIYVTINSFTQKKVRVPYVAGRSLRQAKNMLEIAGLEIARLSYEPDIATNYVLAEIVDGVTMRPNSDLEIGIGSGIVLKVGVNNMNNTTVVPKVVGCTLREAKSRLWEQGLNVGDVIFDEGINKLSEKDAIVYIQSVGYNNSVELGTDVDIYLTLDSVKVGEHNTFADQEAKTLEQETLVSESEVVESSSVEPIQSESPALQLPDDSFEQHIVTEQPIVVEQPVDDEYQEIAEPSYSSNDDIVNALQESSASSQVISSDDDEFF